jgi:tripartite-type tricarboxylate transporter receptor subunit TctC
VAPKSTPGPVQKYIHDAVKVAMEDPLFVNTLKQRVVDADYRAGDQLRADLWKGVQEPRGDADAPGDDQEEVAR